MFKWKGNQKAWVALVVATIGGFLALQFGINVPEQETLNLIDLIVSWESLESILFGAVNYFAVWKKANA